MDRGEGSGRWLPMVGFALVSSANQMLWLNFTPITTGSAAHLGVSASAVGVLAEIFPLVYILLALPAGLALDRWFRPTLLVGAVLTAGGASLRLAGGGFAVVLAGQLVVAIGQPAVLNAVTGLATRTLAVKDRATGIAIGSAGTFVGFVLAFVLGLTLGAGRLHVVLLASAAYAVAGALVLAAALPQIRAGGEATAPAAGRRGLGWPTQTAALREVWADPVMRTVSALVFLGFGVFISLTTWVQTLLTPAGVDARQADRLLVVMVAAGIVSSVAFPPTVARRRLQAASLMLAVPGAAVACILLAVAPGARTGYVALALFGFVLLPALPILLDLVEQRSGPRASTATGLLWLAGNAGGLVVALVVQLLVNYPAPAWIAMALFAAAAFPLAGRLGNQLRAAGPVPGEVIGPQPD